MTPARIQLMLLRLSLIVALVYGAAPGALADDGVFASRHFVLAETSVYPLGGVWNGSEFVMFTATGGQMKAARVSSTGSLLEYRTIGNAPPINSAEAHRFIRVAFDDAGYLILVWSAQPSAFTAYRYDLSFNLTNPGGTVVATLPEHYIAPFSFSELVKMGDRYFFAWSCLDDGVKGARVTSFDEALQVVTPLAGEVVHDDGSDVTDTALATDGTRLLLFIHLHGGCGGFPCGIGAPVFLYRLNMQLQPEGELMPLGFESEDSWISPHGLRFALNGGWRIFDADGNELRVGLNYGRAVVHQSASGALIFGGAPDHEGSYPLSAVKITTRGAVRDDSFRIGAGSGWQTIAAPSASLVWSGGSYRIVRRGIGMTVTPTNMDGPQEVVLASSGGAPSFHPGSTVRFARQWWDSRSFDVNGRHVFIEPSRETPGTLNRLVVRRYEADDITLDDALFYNFTDVKSTHPLQPFVESITRAHLTSGCGNGNFCPDSSLTRAQAAVMLLSARNGWDYIPPEATGTMFGDVPATGFAAAFIEQFARDGVTSGCGGGNYCPDNSLTRQQAAVFLLLTKEGTAFVPPSATGRFADVPVSSSFAPWVEELARRGITAGCGGGNFCPDAAITRGQMAVFLKMTFGLP